jgi:dienelactone hydrolase
MRMLLAALLLASAPQEAAKRDSGTAPCRTLRPGADASLAPLLARYAFADREFTWTLHETRAAETFTVSWLTFPSAVKTPIEQNNTVWCRYWKPVGGTSKRPAALLLHWLGGRFDMLDIVGQRLAENGIAALLMYMPYYGPRMPAGRDRKDVFLEGDVDTMASGFRQAVMDARRAGDWLASRPDVEPSRVGIVGISLGAIVGSLTAGVDDRFGRSVLIIGGGDLPAILLHPSRETAPARKKIEEAGLGPDRLRELWRDIEPCTFAGRLRPEEILMINADADEVIPRAATERFREAAGRPPIRWLKGGHYGIVLQLGPVLKEITAHLSARTDY